jgi:hypothetical protein
MNPTLLLRWTRFASDSHGTGPEKRSAQILHLCEAAGYELSDMKPPARLARGRTWTAGLEARLRLGSHAPIDHAGIGLLGYRTRFYHEALAAHRGARVLLWETTYDTLLPTLARAAGFKIIALPHNLEALVSERVFADPAYDPLSDLSGEISRLGLADAVFTIAKEERWLLEARGLTPQYLPFYPDPALAHECALIRQQRAAAPRAGPLLLLGAALNPATARGMALQLEWLAGLGPAMPAVVVAGPETDTRLAAHRSPRVELKGRVSRPQLIALLQSCSALLIHTRGGAGAVTRIPEALLAGVPVIANSNAARDQHGTPGVHVYDSIGEFRALVLAPPQLPPAPLPPAAASARFVQEISRLAGPTLPP